MKKFLAGILAAVSVFSAAAPAYAAETKVVSKPKEVVYDVVVQKPKIVLNVALPSQVKATLNPYGNDFALNELNTIRTQNGIVSVAYPIHNYDTSYGVFIDAVAVTSTSGSGWDVTKGALTPGVKGANMAFVVSTTEEGVANYSNVSKAATSASSQGNLALDSTVPADSAKGTVKGQTSQQKIGYVPASADGTTAEVIYIGFAGKLSEDAANAPVNWTDSDTINVNLVLKLTPGPKTF